MVWEDASFRSGMLSAHLPSIQQDSPTKFDANLLLILRQIFSVWSDNCGRVSSNWTALEAEGMGASLQVGPRLPHPEPILSPS